MTGDLYREYTVDELGAEGSDAQTRRARAGRADAAAIGQDVILADCPKCGAQVEDLDGFGVLTHDECGYCSHPDSYGGECLNCGAMT